MKKDILNRIHFEWENDNGALSKFRDGDFDEMAFKRLLSSLKEVDFADGEKISHDIVSIIWDIPYFYDAIIAANIKENPDKSRDIKEMRNNLYDEVSRILYFRPSYMSDEAG